MAGPGLATHVLSLLAFNDAYTGFDFGAAAAVATVMLVVLMMFTSAYVRVAASRGGDDVIRSRRQTQRLYDTLAYVVLICASLLRGVSDRLDAVDVAEVQRRHRHGGHPVHPTASDVSELRLACGTGWVSRPCS